MKCDAVVVAKPPLAVELDRHVDAPLLQLGDQVVQPLDGDRVKLLGVVPRVVEQAPVRPVRGIEIAQPHQVDTRSSQPVSECFG